MPRFTLSLAAERDIVSILAWTHEQFGEQARLRYEALLVQAMVDISDDPQRMGSASRDDISSNVKTYHLWHSRNHVERVLGGVRRPRHFLVFRMTNDHQIEISRVLHDSMDLSSHLPDDFDAPTDLPE